ncbi:MAG: hypothetical protein ABII23_01380 [bacterium]
MIDKITFRADVMRLRNQINGLIEKYPQAQKKVLNKLWNIISDLDDIQKTLKTGGSKDESNDKQTGL